MSKWQKHFPLGHSLFMKIAEPRVVRLIHFVIYLCLLTAGLWSLIKPPATYSHILGPSLVYTLGGFVTLGAILGAFAVLPGIWWLERAGILALETGIIIYIAILFAANASMGSIGIVTALGLTFVLRWMEIRSFQLAPRKE